MWFAYGSNINRGISKNTLYYECEICKKFFSHMHYLAAIVHWKYYPSFFCIFFCKFHKYEVMLFRWNICFWKKIFKPNFFAVFYVLHFLNTAIYIKFYSEMSIFERYLGLNIFSRNTIIFVFVDFVKKIVKVVWNILLS